MVSCIQDTLGIVLLLKAVLQWLEKKCSPTQGKYSFLLRKGEQITLKNLQQWISKPTTRGEKHQAEKSTLKYSFIGDTPGVPGRRKCRTAPIVQTE